MATIARAETPEHWRAAGTLFRAYAASLDFDLDFQGFEQEVASLPGDYADPSGCVLLGGVDDEYVGCVAVRGLSDAVCEMKRLYVSPKARGLGLGRDLVRGIIDEARAMGYRRMRLDTVPSMLEARSLYAASGFRVIAPYRHNPVPGTDFMEVIL